MKRSVLGAVAIALALVATSSRSALAQTPVSWDGGNGNWEDANWNGGQTPEATMGNDSGGDGGHDIMIGGGSQVFYNSELRGDFGPDIENGPTIVTIKEGATLEINTPIDGDEDGNWSQFDADLTLDNGTLNRTLTPGGTALSGGILMFGSWNSIANQQIDINIKNGGHLFNDGQLWFGADEEHAVGLKVHMTIDDGTVDLTGGTFVQSNDDNLVVADLAMFFGRQFAEGDGVPEGGGDGSSKNNEYIINFKGPGSMTVDSSGIWVYDQEESSFWTATQATYENLWDRGILRSDGAHGGTGGVAFANHFTVTGTSGSNDYTLTRKNPVLVTWDGGNGNWEDANWNGGQTPEATMGDDQGGEGGHDIVIGGGAQVFYNSEIRGDFHPRVNNGPGGVTVKEGATLEINTPSDGDEDGNWSQFDTDLTLDNGTLNRTLTTGGGAMSGGILMFGSWNSRPSQEIDITVKNGSTFTNDGQVWFGADEEHAVGLKVSMTIDDGTVDLTGGTFVQSNDDNLVVADLAMFFGRQFAEGNGTAMDGSSKGNEYTINFTGPGSITVDSSGIWVYDQEESSFWTATQTEYEDLWDRGILQANGLSGLDGEMFGDYFSVTGTSGADNYILTRLIGLDGDYNGDGKVDAADYTVIIDQSLGTDAYNLWVANFGAGTGAGAGGGAAAGAVPEPSTIALAMGLLLVGLAGRRFRS